MLKKKMIMIIMAIPSGILSGQILSYKDMDTDGSIILIPGVLRYHAIKDTRTVTRVVGRIDWNKVTG